MELFFQIFNGFLGGLLSFIVAMGDVKIEQSLLVFLVFLLLLQLRGGLAGIDQRPFFDALGHHGAVEKAHALSVGLQMLPLGKLGGLFVFLFRAEQVKCDTGFAAQMSLIVLCLVPLFHNGDEKRGKSRQKLAESFLEGFFPFGPPKLDQVEEEQEAEEKESRVESKEDPGVGGKVAHPVDADAQNAEQGEQAEELPGVFSNACHENLLAVKGMTRMFLPARSA